MIIHTSGLPAIGDDETMLAEEYFYLIGSTAPRYPVPAIRITEGFLEMEYMGIVFHPFVVMEQQNDGQWLLLGLDIKVPMTITPLFTLH